MSELLMIEQRGGRGGAVPWILDRHGRIDTAATTTARRLAEVRAGLMRHAA